MTCGLAGFHTELGDPPIEQGIETFRETRTVDCVGQGPERTTRPVVGAGAVDAFDHAVGVHHHAVGVDQQHAYRRVVKGTGKARLGLLQGGSEFRRSIKVPAVMTSGRQHGHTE